MTMILDKEEMLFERDESGSLISKEVVVIRLPNKPTIRITPITRGEFKRIREGLNAEGNTTEDQDGDIILSHLIEPKITKEEIKFMKKSYVDSIVLTIFDYSSLVVKENLKDAIDENNNEIKKN